MVTNQQKPQVAIVSVEDLRTLEEARGRKSTLGFLKLVGIIPKGSDLPKDLSQNHDKYTWN